MEQRSFGSNKAISVLGIGCGRLGSIHNPVPMREVRATLEAAIEAGISHFDTASIYGQGDSERILGELLRHHRDRMFVVTKVGGRHGRFAGMVRMAKPLLRMAVRSRPPLQNTVINVRTATVSQDFSSHALTRAVEGSRRRLGLDQLDGLLLHSPSPETLGTAEVHDFLGDLLRKDVAACVGVSVDSFEAAEVAVTIPELSILQIPMDVAIELSKSPILEEIRRRKIGVFVRDVLGVTRAGRSVKDAISATISQDFIASAIIGVSTREHLDGLLGAVK
jgi:aryl-alcohol dehydrogenase-like predicted oxidoreductase